MKSSYLLTVLALSLTLGYSDANAATAEFQRADSLVSVDAAAEGAPPNGHVAEFFVTTDADILSVRDLRIDLLDGELFNVPCVGEGCSDFDSPPLDPCFVCFFVGPSPADLVDTWVTTPGDTFYLGADLPGDGMSYAGDFTNDGAQNAFQFARVTVSNGARGTFSGLVSLAGSTGPERFPFSFALGVPEPGGITLAMATLALTGLFPRRRPSRFSTANQDA